MSIDAPQAAVEQEQSLRGYLARRRRQLRENKSIDLPVPGYEGALVARYHVLDYVILRRIGERNDQEPDKFAAELYTAADTLANACSGLYEVKENGELESTGYRWSTQAARELFEIGEDELPRQSTARDALLSIFPNDTSVVIHFGDYSRLTQQFNDEVENRLSGESAAA